MSDGRATSTEQAMKTQIEALEQLVVVPQDSLVKADPQVAKENLAAEEKYYDDELTNQEVADRKSARKQRETYADRIFHLVYAWSVLVVVIVIIQGISSLFDRTFLSDKVLIALITSTTANLIGTLIIVLKYIFKVQSHKSLS